MFARSVVENKDIILKTKGNSKRQVIYTTDAVSAILAVLLRGASGQSYTACNHETFVSIKDTASLICEKIAEKIIRNNLIIDFNHPCGYCEKSECYTYPVSLIPGYCYCPGCECLHPREDSASPSGSLMLNY